MESRARDLGGPVERQHASDQVFREIATAILRRELGPGSPLPPERELSDRFGVSRIVVREAIHRLKEYELVRVRQGSPTLVLDPDEATDIRLLSLEIELMPDVESLNERHVYAGAALLALAEQKMTDAEIEALEKLVDDFFDAPDGDGKWMAFERAYWLTIGKGTRNRILLRETTWFFNLLQREERFRAGIFGSPQGRAHLYKKVAENLRKRSGTVDLYLRALRNMPPADVSE